MKKLLAIVLVLMLAISMLSCAVAEEKLYIPVIAKGFQHQYWQTVYKGAQQAAEDYGVDLL